MEQSRMERKKSDTRSKVVAAALKLFQARGYDWGDHGADRG